MVGLAEGDVLAADEEKLVGGADFVEACVDGGEVDGVGGFAEQAEEDSSVGAVADTGERERSVEIDAEGGGPVDEMLRVELADEAKRRAHGPDGVRGAGADTDFEELEEACVHGEAVTESVSEEVSE